MGAPKKHDNKSIPKSREEEDEDEDSLGDVKEEKVVDEDEDFDGPLDDLAFDDFGDDDDDEF